MKFIVLYLLMAVTLVLLGVTTRDIIGKVAYWYIGFSFAFVGGLYLVRPNLSRFKKAEGNITTACWVAFLPYFAFARLSFFMKGISTREPSFNLITENVYLGRWHRAREADVFARLNIQAILDLTWEFDEPRELVAGRHYLNLPVLDGAAPTPEQLRVGAEWLARRATEGPVAIHCAFGHGRSVTVLMVYMLSFGHAVAFEDAVKLINRRRPRAALNSEQRTAIVRYTHALVAAGNAT